jgi:hypothetical protein
MTRVKTADLIDHVASEAGVEKSVAKRAIEAVFAGIVDAAKKGEDVNLPGFGKFKDGIAEQAMNYCFFNCIFTGLSIESAKGQAEFLFDLREHGSEVRLPCGGFFTFVIDRDHGELLS